MTALIEGVDVSSGGADDGVDELGPAGEAEEDELREVTFADLARARQTSGLPTARSGAANLPLGELDPEVLERLAAEMIKRQQNLGAHFYGRRGQKQHGLDILEREAVDSNSVYQVRRYDVLTPDMITSAVTEYADPKPPKEGGEKPARRFAARRYVLFTSAEFETETALQDRLEELQEQYAGDLIIEVWGREMISGKLRDCGPLVNSVFGPEWARLFCGFAPPPPDPADPVGLGLVENPVQVLKNLDALAEDAKARESSDPAESARLYGILAEALGEANFPAHAARQRRQQARLLQAAGDRAGTFAVLWDLARDHFTSGAASAFGSVYPELDGLRSGLDEQQAAKLDALAAAQSWYEQGSQLSVAVPALETVAAQHDRDTAFLACVLLEQALVDCWYDYDPPYSLVPVDGTTANLLARLRQCTAAQSCADVVIRARLACAVADTGLTANSSTADTQAAYAELLEQAGAGRYREAGGLVTARAARAFAMHGDTGRAINLWRQSILLSSESRLYGDVLGCRRALNAAILEHPIPAFAELDYPASLPNSDRLLATDREAELGALREAHDGKLPDAFGVTRRWLWESRLSGQLSDERDALELFGDVLLAAGRPQVAVTAWVMAGAGGKAADVARRLGALLQVEGWARSPARACQAAAARVIGAQARLYDAGAAERMVHLLLGLTAGLWTSPLIAPNPALDAVNALRQFGINLPAGAVDPVLELVKPWLAAGGALRTETVDLLIQLYWAVPGRRDDIADVIGSQLGIANPPPELWEMIANLPGQAREQLTAAVTAQADAGNPEALRTLAYWKEPTAAVQMAARRTCARLLRQPAGDPATTWSRTTRFHDAAVLASALATATSLIGVDPLELRPGAGAIVTEKVQLSVTISPLPPVPGTVPPSGEDQVAASGAETPDSHAGTDGPGEPAAENPEGGPEPGTWEPDAASRVAAASPAELAAAVADHLLAVAASSNPPAFVRADALAALDLLRAHLPAEVNARHAGRLLAIAENPVLSVFDELEIASGDPLSRGRLNLGARELPALALVMAASAAASAAQVGDDVEGLPPPAGLQMIIHALHLLRGSDADAAKHGAMALALAYRYDPGLPDYRAMLIAHPNAEVRAVAAAAAVLDVTAQRVLVTDPSPQVRANLASHASELVPEVIAALRSDEHPDVKRALASTTERTAG
jgi:hypothetical protein